MGPNNQFDATQTPWGMLAPMCTSPPPGSVAKRARRARGWAALVCAALALAACDDSDEDKDDKNKSVVNLEAYQGFFAHYPFGGHPVATWTERLNALAPGGAEANPAAYRLARSRAEQSGLLVTGDAQAHTVRIKPALLQKLIDHVDSKESP